MQTDSTSLVLITAVLVALVFALIALINANKALARSKRQNMENIFRDVLRMYMGFEGTQRIKTIVNEELAKQQGKSVAQTTQTSAGPFTLVTSPAKSETTEQAEPAVEEKPDEPQRVPEEISLPKPVTLFTGSYSTGSFRHITPVPDEKTVFTIYTDNADAKEGVLNIDESAYAKVAQTPDYLKNACSYSGTGTQLRVIQTGKVVKENGTWTVTEPIIAEFN